MASRDIYAQVTEQYSRAANSTAHAQSDALAQAFGYSEEQLSLLPQGANLGLSCGNPLALATLREVSELPKAIRQTPAGG